MNLITVAILTAVAVGVTAGVTEVSKQGVLDACQRLKDLFIQRLGRNRAVSVIDPLETNSQSSTDQSGFAEKAQYTDAMNHPELVQVVEALQKQLQPSAQTQIIGNNFYGAVSQSGAANVAIYHGRSRESSSNKKTGAE